MVPIDSHRMQSNKSKNNAYIRILEQPSSKAVRFRYECEGRSAAAILGVNSTQENKTYPAIQVCGFEGRAIVFVSCVAKDPPYRPHPYILVGKEGCKKGVCTLEINPDTMIVSFSNLGIQCVKKKDIAESLKIRETVRVDPFRTGFAHRFHSTDLNAVRLCFQVLLEDRPGGKYTVPIDPVVSDPIFDKKANSELIIYNLSDCSCTVNGGRKIILLCEKVVKEDISIRFYEEQDGCVVWEGYGIFNHSCVFKQVAIDFKTPTYKDLNIEKPVRVNIQLKRPSDGVTSDPLPFDFLPMDTTPEDRKRKRQKLNGDAYTNLLSYLNDQQLQNSATIGTTEDFIKKTKINFQQNKELGIPLTNGTDPYGFHGNLPPAYNIGQNQKSTNYYPLSQAEVENIPSLHNVISNAFSTQPRNPESLEMPSAFPLQPAVTNNLLTSYNIPAGCISNFHQYPGNVFNVNGGFKNVALYEQQSPNRTPPISPTMHHQQNFNGSYNSNYSNLINMDNQHLAQCNAVEMTRFSEVCNYNYNPNNVVGQNNAEALNISNKVDDIEHENMTDSFTRLAMNQLIN